MQEKTKPEQPVATNPVVTFANTDKLSRKASADILTRLISNEPGPLVLTIDSAWGTGKTTFLDMWEHELKKGKEPFPVIRINTWETDYTDQPFASLIVSIRKHIIAFDKAQTGAVENVTNKFCEAACNVLKNSPSIAVSLLSGGSVDLKKAISSDKHCTELDRYEEFAGTLEVFKQELKNFVEWVSRAHHGKPVLLMVDELDRCRPTYAIEFLEVVKHLFSVEKLIFILAINKTELAHSMKVVYGVSCDTEGYLRRFFDVEYHLSNNGLGDYCKNLLSVHGYDSLLSDLTDYGTQGFLDEVFQKLATITQLDLRTLESIIRRLTYIIKVSPKISVLSHFILHLLFLKQLCHDDYQSLLHEKLTLSNVLANKIPPNKMSMQYSIYTPILKSLISGYISYFEDPNAAEKRISQNAQRDRTTVSDVESDCLRIAKVHVTKAFSSNNPLRDLLNAIELVNNFE